MCIAVTINKIKKPCHIIAGPNVLLIETLVQVLRYLFAHGLHFAREHRYHVAFFIDQELGEVPFNGIFNTQLLSFFSQVFE